VSWFRSAAIYLVLTAILLGAVWLFWGKDIETAWKKAKENPIVKKTQDKLPKELTQKKPELAKELSKKKAELAKVEIPPAVTGLPANAAVEWQKTRSGAAGLIEVQKHENMRDLQTLTVKHDNRMIEILKLVKLYKEPKPAVIAAPIPPAKALTSKNKKEKEKHKPKPALKPMF
jgi:hypothetical protein